MAMSNLNPSSEQEATLLQLWERYPFIRFGSENSLDVDVVYVFPSSLSPSSSSDHRHDEEDESSVKQKCELPNRHLLLRFCNYHKAQNRNVMMIDRETGVVRECLKGLPDELNNAVRSTFHLHEQVHYHFPGDDDNVNNGCPFLSQSVERVIVLKVVRAIRSILSRVSRTRLRPLIKKALQSQSLSEYVRVLSMIDFGELPFIHAGDSDNDNDSRNNNKDCALDMEACKSIAFQLAQTFCLMTHHNEIWTKNQVSQTYPELELFMKRDPNSSRHVDRLTELCSKTIGEMEGIVSFSLDRLNQAANAGKSQKKCTLNLILYSNKSVPLSTSGTRQTLPQQQQLNAISKQCIGGIVVDMFPGYEKCVHFGLDSDAMCRLIEEEHRRHKKQIVFVQPFIHNDQVFACVSLYDRELGTVTFDEQKSIDCTEKFGEQLNSLLQRYPDQYIVCEMEEGLDMLHPIVWRNKYTNYIGQPNQ